MQDFNPLTPHPKVADLEEQYELVADLWRGTDAMREASTTYLPKEPAEVAANYARRLDRTVLYPAYKQAILSAVGKLFAKDITVERATPEMEYVLDNLDEDSNNLEVFAQEATRSALHYGCSYILIDYPVVEDGAFADATPYWVLIEAPAILEASPIKWDGKNRLGVFRFQEQVAYRASEFEVKYQTQVKEFRLDPSTDTVTFRVFQLKNSQWVVVDEGTLVGMVDIPVVPMYGNKVGYYLGSPTFYDLARENVLNWQLQSDYQNIVHMSSVPMLMVKGAGGEYDENGVKRVVIISPNTVLDFANPDADAKWIEVTGSASDVSHQALIDSGERMAKMSLDVINQVNANKTATEVAVIAETANAILRSIQDELQDAMNLAIDFTYQYLQVPNPGTTVELTTSEAVLELTAQTDELPPSGDVAQP